MDLFCRAAALVDAGQQPARLTKVPGLPQDLVNIFSILSTCPSEGSGMNKDSGENS